MKRDSLVVVYTLVGGVFGAAIAIALPIWTVIWADIGDHCSLWVAFEPLYRPSRHFEDYIFPVLIAATLIGIGLFCGRKLGKGVAVGMVQRGYCKTCSYNLTGNTSGVCPECGTPIR